MHPRYFAPPLDRCSLLPDAQGFRPHRGTGYVTYQDEAAANAAQAALNGYTLHDRTLRVHKVVTRPGGPDGAAAGTALGQPAAPYGGYGAAGSSGAAAPGGFGQSAGGVGWQQPAYASSGGPGPAGASPYGRPGVAYGSVGQATGAAGQSGWSAHAGAPGVQAHPSHPPQAVLPLAVSPSVSAAVAALSPAELWSIMSEMKAEVDSNRENARALLTQFPVLAAALLLIQERLGMLQAAPGTSATATLTQSAPAGAVPGPPAGGLLPTPSAMHGQAYAPIAGSAGSTGPAPPAAPAGAPPAYHAAAQALAPQPPAPAAAAGPQHPAPVLSAADQEQLEMIQSLLAMSDAEVAGLPSAEREGVVNVRDAVRWPLAAIMATPAARREELLQLRHTLQYSLGMAVNPA
jgi:hypothetical protein